MASGLDEPVGLQEQPLTITQTSLRTPSSPGLAPAIISCGILQLLLSQGKGQLTAFT